MGDSVPNLRAWRGGRVEIQDETPVEHLTCHCGHVTKLDKRVIQVEVQFGLAAKFIGICVVAIVGIGAKVAWDVVKMSVRAEAPIQHAGERLAPDRVAEPQR